MTRVADVTDVSPLGVLLSGHLVALRCEAIGDKRADKFTVMTHVTDVTDVTDVLPLWLCVLLPGHLTALRREAIGDARVDKAWQMQELLDKLWDAIR